MEKENMNTTYMNMWYTNKKERKSFEEENHMVSIEKWDILGKQFFRCRRRHCSNLEERKRGSYNERSLRT